MKSAIQQYKDTFNQTIQSIKQKTNNKTNALFQNFQDNDQMQRIELILNEVLQQLKKQQHSSINLDLKWEEDNHQEERLLKTISQKFVEMERNILKTI